MSVVYVSERFRENGTLSDTLILFTEAKKIIENSGVHSFEHSSKIIKDNFKRRRFSGNYNISPRFYINHNNHSPSRSPLNPTHYESNLTHESIFRW